MPGRGKGAHPVHKVCRCQAVGFLQRAAGVFGLDSEVPQIAGGFHQRPARKGAAREAGRQCQLPAQGLGIQVSWAVHQHPAHTAFQGAGMGAEKSQQLVIRRIDAAFVQRNGKEEPAVFYRSRQTCGDTEAVLFQSVCQRFFKALRGAPAGADNT